MNVKPFPPMKRLEAAKLYDNLLMVLMDNNIKKDSLIDDNECIYGLTATLTKRFHIDRLFSCFDNFNNTKDNISELIDTVRIDLDLSKWLNEEGDIKISINNRPITIDSYKDTENDVDLVFRHSTMILDNSLTQVIGETMHVINEKNKEKAYKDKINKTLSSDKGNIFNVLFHYVRDNGKSDFSQITEIETWYMRIPNGELDNTLNYLLSSLLNDHEKDVLDSSLKEPNTHGQYELCISFRGNKHDHFREFTIKLIHPFMDEVLIYNDDNVSILK